MESADLLPCQLDPFTAPTTIPASAPGSPRVQRPLLQALPNRMEFQACCYMPTKYPYIYLFIIYIKCFVVYTGRRQAKSIQLRHCNQPVHEVHELIFGALHYSAVHVNVYNI